MKTEKLPIQVFEVDEGEEVKAFYYLIVDSFSGGKHNVRLLAQYVKQF